MPELKTPKFILGKLLQRKRGLDLPAKSFITGEYVMMAVFLVVGIFIVLMIRAVLH